MPARRRSGRVLRRSRRLLRLHRRRVRLVAILVGITYGIQPYAAPSTSRGFFGGSGSTTYARNRGPSSASEKRRTRSIVRCFSSAGSFHGYTVISAFGASEATSIEVCSGCAGTSSPWT